jgi:serine/threonine protein kinase
MRIDPAMFKREFTQTKFLNSGSDGAVMLYSHRSLAGPEIAVKAPFEASVHQVRNLFTEIKVVRTLSCKQVVALLGYDEEWEPIAPALFYEYCELGDLHHYQQKLLNLKNRGGSEWSVPEETIWKVFADMAKGLDYLHNVKGIVHGDFKPDNVLVAKPKNCHEDFPFLPDFKICDFARSVNYKDCSNREKWNGTCEYAPLLIEQDSGPVSPAMDIWGLGATLQELALVLQPVQSMESFVKDYYKRTGTDLKALRRLPDFKRKQYWRRQFEVVYRPLNASHAELVQLYDWPFYAHLPGRYSDVLNSWYSRCLVPDPSQRVTSSALVQHLVPVAERQIASLVAKRKSWKADAESKAVAFFQSWFPKRPLADAAESFQKGTEQQRNSARHRQEPPVNFTYSVTNSPQNGKRKLPPPTAPNSPEPDVRPALPCRDPELFLPEVSGNAAAGPSHAVRFARLCRAELPPLTPKVVKHRKDFGRSPFPEQRAASVEEDAKEAKAAVGCRGSELFLDQRFGGLDFGFEDDPEFLPDAPASAGQPGSTYEPYRQALGIGQQTVAEGPKQEGDRREEEASTETSGKTRRIPWMWR